ncbi:MAG: DUF72 domain-containing protein [Candidatus Firestonebacteria bacterium]
MIKIGTSGFSFDDWKGTAYPLDIKKPDMLSYYTGELGFHTVELNFTYYALPSEKTFIGMLEKVPKDFMFSVKGYRGFTHDPFDIRLGHKRPRIERARQDLAKFASAIRPLLEAKQLACVLLQFPLFFTPGPQSADYIMQCKYLLPGIPLVVEFRNNKWAVKETFDFLRNNKLGFCAVDEPQIPRLMPFVPEVTSDIGYIRFHGRNNNWFNAPLEVRYDYLYKKEELTGFIPAIKEMEKKSKTLLMYFNNCHMGSAVRNAKDLQLYTRETGI